MRGGGGVRKGQTRKELCRENGKNTMDEELEGKPWQKL